MQWDTLNNLWDTIANQPLWLGVAVVLVVLVLVFLAAYKTYKPKPRDTIPNQREGWTPTGRVDFSDPQSVGDFILQAEDTRIVSSMGGVEHREIRWRKATLDEAKMVVVAYHAQRNLAVAANYVVSSRAMLRRNSDPKGEHQEAPLGKDEVVGRIPKTRRVFWFARRRFCLPYGDCTPTCDLTPN